jgi:DNA mismatch endonuclease, patch repair protein
MADVVSRSVRSRMMSSIRSKNTRPEIMIRQGLHRVGFRFRLHAKHLPGRPDIVLPKWNAVIFVHGCFWHGHRCHLYRPPKTRRQFWLKKIRRNRRVDIRAVQALRKDKWRVGMVWECAIKGRAKLPPAEVFRRCTSWIDSASPFLEIKGKTRRRVYNRTSVISE